MCDEMTTALVRLLAPRCGTAIRPKADGRIEIPHGIVRLMGWPNGQAILVTRRDGYIEVSDGCGPDVIGQVVVSMERVRIPSSILRKAGMAGKTVVVSPVLGASRRVVVRSSLVNALEDLRKIVQDAGPETRNRLYAALGGQMADPEQVPAPDSHRMDPEPPVAEPKTPDAEAELFLPNHDAPTVIRILGPAVSFQTHWVSVGQSGGALAPHNGSNCRLCGTRAPEAMAIIPAITRRKSGDQKIGYMLVKEDLRSRIGRVLHGDKPESMDLILYYRPFADGMYEVFRNPPEPMPDDIIQHARDVCGNPLKFLGTILNEPEKAIPARMPTVLVAGHFADSMKPRNLGK